MLGAKFVPRALAAEGFQTTAYRVLSATEYPSWGHWMKRGATTLWEDWNGDASLNHIFFGDVSAWFFNHLAGIRPDVDKPGFEHIRIEPLVPADLQHVHARFASVRGPIESARSRTQGGVLFTIVVPPNGRATVELPAKDITRVTENGKPLRQAQGIHVREASVLGVLRLEVGSGDYRIFRARSHRFLKKQSFNANVTPCS